MLQPGYILADYWPSDYWHNAYFPTLGAANVSWYKIALEEHSPTFSGGTFTGVATGIDPVLSTHLATKGYVDSSVNTFIDYYFSDTADGVIAGYNVAYSQPTGEVASSVISGTLTTGNNQLLASFISPAGDPGIAELRSGIYDTHIHASKTGTKPVTLYATISARATGGAETLVATTEPTGLLTGAATGYNIHAIVATPVTIAVTDRIVVKWYANVAATGSDVVVTLALEGTNNSHVTISLPASVYQRHGDVLDDLNTLGAVASDGQIIVGTGAGTFAYESGATLRTSIGVDAAGTGASLVGAHESTYNHANYNTAYSHSQLVAGNPHSVTPTELSLVIGTNTQAYSARLGDIAALAVTDSNIIVGNGTNWVAESGATARTSLGLGTGDSPTLTALTLTNGQLVFPSTQVPSANVNTLDDYEEGTWIPTLAFGGGSTGVTYSVQQGTYTKIGRVVIIQGHVAITSKGSDTGAMTMAGLPFTTSADGNSYTPVTVRFQNLAFANQLTGIVLASATSVGFYETSSAGTETTITNADAADNTRMLISGFLRV